MPGISGRIATFAVCALFGGTYPSRALPPQASPPTHVEIQPFLGTWQAKFKGKVFETLNLKEQDGKLVGTATRAEIELNQEGELTGAKAIAGTDEIIDTKLTGGILHLTSKPQEEDDTVQFDMNLVGTDHAELRIVTPPGMRAPKAWTLEREKAARQP
jgi:hypothetical protein